MMKERDYNRKEHCCKHCGNLMPYTPRDLEAHTPEECLRIKYYKDEREKIVNKGVDKCSLM